MDEELGLGGVQRSAREVPDEQTVARVEVQDPLVEGPELSWVCWVDRRRHAQGAVVGESLDDDRVGTGGQEMLFGRELGEGKVDRLDGNIEGEVTEHAAHSGPVDEPGVEDLA